MGDDITIGVTEIVNNIEVTAQPSDQVIELSVIDNADDVTLNITPTVVEININRGSSFARWGTILGNLPDQEDLQNVLNLKADLVGGLVPASQLPSYVDDIVEVANYAALPVVGETGKIYLTLDNNKIFRWSGSVYIEIASDSGYVHIAGAETITGLKTFTETAKFDLNINLSKTGLFNVPSLYNTIGAYNTEFKFGIDNSRIAIVDLASLTAPRIYNYPDKDGIFAMTSDLHSAVTIGTANGLSLSGQELSLGLSSASTNGSLSSTDWSKFNSAVPAGTPTTGDFVYYNGSNLAYKALLASAPLSFNSGTGTFSISQANTSTNGYLSSTDWNTFNNKQGGLSGTGFVKISGTTISYDNSTYALDNSVVHLAGTETISGVKTFSSQMTAAKILMSNSSIDRSLELTNSSSGQSIYVVNTGSGNAIQNLNNGNSGIGFMSANSITATGNLYQGNFNGGRVFSVGSEGAGYFAGNVGIGTTSPNRLLTVSGTQGLMSFNATSYRNTTIGSDSIGNFIVYDDTASSYRMVINSSGNVGIGTTSPDNKLSVNGGASILGGSSPSGNGLHFYFSSNTAYIKGFEAGVDWRNIDYNGLNHIFRTYDAERMRITSGGDVLVGTTAAINSSSNTSTGATFAKVYNWLAITDSNYIQRSNNTNGDFFYFLKGSTNVGSITVSGSTTLYNVTSDYRLKQDFKPFNGLDLVSKIKVYDYEWKADKSRMNGVIAHELQEVVPYAVSGEKDAEKMQQVDYSKLVPILVQAIQDQQKQIDELKTLINK